MKICTQCRQSFQVTERDTVYYKKISVPEPTHCPGCRMQRRFAHRNERNLYHRKCNLTGKQIISMYHPDCPFPVYEQSSWWSDAWDGLTFGRDIDWSKPFFEQLCALQSVVPRSALFNVNRENSDYCNFTGDVKNSYLIFGSVYSEDCYYGSPYSSKNCVDTLVVRECELCYECTDCRKCYECLFCQDCVNSGQLLYCSDVQGSTDCIGCVGLRNKKFCIFNEQLSESEYIHRKEQIDLCNESHREMLSRKLRDLKLSTPHRYMQSSNVQNVSGDHVYTSKNTFHSFFADNCEDVSYSAQVVDLKDCSDNNYTEENELCYEYLGMYGTQRTFFSILCRHTNEVYYSDSCISSQNLFGCIGVRNKQFCILNKQYSEADYRTMVQKLIIHMSSTRSSGSGSTTGEWGEYLSMKYSPFAYNESVAQEYFPMSKESALSSGLRWRDPDDTVGYQGPVTQVPTNIADVPDDITEKILTCQITNRPYKILKQELVFYRRMRLPIPLVHPDERHKRRLSQRNPRQLWLRSCSKCQKPIESTFAPDRPEQINCESCYLGAVY